MGLTAKLQRKRAKAEAKAEADRLVYESNEELCRKMDGLWLYTLHEEFGFGHKRLNRLYWAMIENYRKVMLRYNRMADNDDTEWYAMEKHLRDIGIDLKKLQAEADKLYPEGVGAAVRKEYEGERLL